MTVKVKDAPKGGSEGLIAVSRLLGSRLERSPGEVPVMPGAQIYQVVESNDPRRRSRQVLMSSSSAVPTVAHYYQGTLTNAGWKQAQYTDTPRKAGRPAGSFMVFLRDRSEMQLSVAGGADGRGCIISATLVTKDTAPAAF
jgi:pyruvate/2-oxoglutarate dehydrogenase complex dihydrolipoamide acyltransferase (E2) component